MSERDRYQATLRELESASLLPDAEEWTPEEARTRAQQEGADPETWVVINLTTYPDIERRLGEFVDKGVEDAADVLFWKLKEAYRLADDFLG